MSNDGTPLHVDRENTDKHPVSQGDLGRAFVRIAACEDRVEAYRDEAREQTARFLTIQWDPLRKSVNRLVITVAVAIAVGTVNSVLMAIALWVHR